MHWNIIRNIKVGFMTLISIFGRFYSITLRRTQESSSKHDGMEYNTGCVEAIIF